MAITFPLVLMDFTVHAEFNHVLADVGPGMGRQIRYSKADYLAMITKYFTGFRQGGPVPWGGPNSVDYTLFFDSDSVNTVTSEPGTIGPPLDLSFSLSSGIEHDSSQDDFSECPFIDGVSPPRETAAIVNQATLTGGVSFSLFNPYCLQSGWDTATEFWLSFDFAISAGSLESYTCDPSGTHGGITGPPIPSNYLGIDWTGGTAFPSATSSIPLGDGTTSAYFLDPGTADKVIVNGLQSNN